jgi:alkylation response protein AidB-like acyl-CoA dehydrogenase
MQSIMRTSLLLAGAVLLLDGAAARAVDFQNMTAKVPFPFVVHDKTLPAGKYLLQRDESNTALLLISNENGRHVGSFVLTNPAAGHDPEGDKACLAFTRQGDTYRLSNVWESRDDGISVIGKKQESARQ